jgi:tetratricopeptide (TPR) repeat protein
MKYLKTKTIGGQKMTNHIKMNIHDYRILWLFICTVFFLSSCNTTIDQKKIYQFISLQNEAYQLFYQRNYSEAEKAAKEVLEFTEKEFGPHSIETRSSLINLGNFYLAQGRYAESESFFLRSLMIAEINPYLNIQGSGEIPNRDLLVALVDLADIYSIQEKYNEAEPLYEQALSLMHRQPRSLTMWNVLEKLNKCYRKSGKENKTEEIENIMRRFRKEPEKK